jgi:hypothetical protein
MGLLNLFGKSSSKLVPLPAGTFTVDKEGRILASTVSQAFPASLVKDIGAQVLTAFRTAEAARVPLTEFVLRYSMLKLTARELRGGAIVFLVPHMIS